MPYAGTFDQFKAKASRNWTPAQLRTGYRRLTGPAPAPTSPATPVAAPRAAFTPGSLDEEGQATDGMLSAARRRALGSDGNPGTIEADYQEQAAGLNAQLPRIQQGYEESLRNNSNNVSGRGLGRSGIKTLYDTRSLASYNDQTNEVTNSLKRLSDQRTSAELEANSAYNTGASANLAQSNARQLSAFQDQGRTALPDAVAPAAPAAPTPTAAARPKPTFAEFQAKAGPRHTLAQLRAGYQRLYGG